MVCIVYHTNNYVPFLLKSMFDQGYDCLIRAASFLTSAKCLLAQPQFGSLEINLLPILRTFSGPLELHRSPTPVINAFICEPRRTNSCTISSSAGRSKLIDDGHKESKSTSNSSSAPIFDCEGENVPYAQSARVARSKACDS